MQPTPILSTLIYPRRGDKVLLMQRRKPPNLGLWVAPGGKLEWNESPAECARRELLEETGLHAERLTLRGHITEWSPRADWQWMMWLYIAEGLSGDLVGDEREGDVRWWSLTDALTLPMPEADQVFMPRILKEDAPFYEARMVYDADLALVDVVEA
jgi:8-oxo-dGTP diphosphatase